MSPLLRRLAHGLGANAFSQGANVAMQLVSLPLFLARWDAATYGGWLILTALPSYLYMADGGMVSAAGNEMTMAVGRGKASEAQSALSSATVFMLCVCGVVAAVAMPAALWLPWPGAVTTDQRVALCVMVVSVLLQLLYGLVDAVFRSTERYALGMSIGTLFSIGSWAGTMAALQINGSYTSVALGGLFVQAIGLVVSATTAMRAPHGLRWSVAGATVTHIRSMVKPALSFMAFPLSNALSFQGMTLLVGSLLGPAAVAVFNTGRTMARIGVQVTGLFSHAAWPEFARLYGQGGTAAIALLYRRSAWGAGGLAVLISVAGLVLSPWILKFWSHGGIEFHADLMAYMAGYAALAGAWHVPRVLLMATNRHALLAVWTVVAALIGLALAWALVPSMGVAGAAAAMLVSEAVVAVQCLRLARQFMAPAAFEQDAAVPA